MGVAPQQILGADLGIAAAFAGALLATIAAGELLRSRSWMTAASTRRFIHCLTGLLVAGTPFAFRYPHFLYLLAALFAVFNFAAIRRGWLRSMHADGGTSYGTAVFPLALIFALAVGWSAGEHRLFSLQAAFLVLAISDPLASIVGNRVERATRFRIGRGTKSLEGSLAFFVSAFLVLAATLQAFRWLDMVPFDPFSIVLIAGCVAAVAACAEALATRGWDNLFIVLAVMVPLIFLHENPELQGRFFLGVGLAAVFTVAAVRLRFLDLSGGLAAALLAVSVVGFGGWEWAVPAFAFFVLSSLLSALRKQAAPYRAVHDVKGSTRDAEQVYANGGAAWAVLIAHALFPHEVWFWAFAGAFATAAADTWATEIGTMLRRTARHILTWRRVEAGTSGGVSVPGTVAAAAGAAVIGLAAVWADGGLYAPVSYLAFLATVTGAGFAGSLVDSVAGAAVQARYVDEETGLQTERPMSRGRENRLAGGYPWMTNDRVNWLCTISGAAAAAALRVWAF